MDNVEKIGAVKHTGQIKERSKNEKNLIKKFLRNKDVAAWFRGTSIFHLQGANELFNAIRDDTEQRTVHRVRQCLNMIGLDPIIPAKDLKFLMKLSQGNDLAFLWFLMERYYKGAKSSMYNINQQLICSAICHLDMITTLRELDKILPISSGTTAVKKKRRSVQGSVSEYLNIPYLEKIPRPRPYGKPLTINVPDFAVQFNTYKGYTDPNFVVHNECNRWFAQYDFNPGRRVAFNIIRHAIDSIFEDFEAAQLKASTIKALCNYHKAMTELEESHRFELTVNIRDRCLEKCFGNNVNEADERYCHAKESLQKAVDKQLSEFGKLTAYVRKDMILKLLTTDCNIVGIDVGESSGMYNGGLEADKNSKEKSSQMKNLVQHVPSKIVIENLKKTNLDSAQINGLMSGMSSSHTSVFAAKYLQNYDIDDGTVDSIATSSQRFFHAPTVCRPHTFDYRQIFLYQKHDNKWQMAFLEALSKDLSTLTALQKAESQIAFAASECASTIWKNHLHSYILEGRDLHISKGPSVIPFLRHQEVETNNTEDRAIIDKILADACNYLRKNPKFVMAQLPEAHKLPMLREWISRRFGKVYSPKERRHSYRYSLQIFHALDRMPFNFSTPTAEQLSKNQFVPYDCKTYLSRKVKYVKDGLYRRLDNAIMKQSRTYWFAMRGYLCSGPGPPRQTFFAYMPSRLRDIQRFRLWKLSEHRPDKAEWDKRRRQSKFSI